MLSPEDLRRVDRVAQSWGGAGLSPERRQAVVERALSDAATNFDADGAAFLVHALTVLRRHLKQLKRQ